MNRRRIRVYGYCPLRGLVFLLLALATSNHAQAQTASSNFKFDFGPGKVRPGYTQILAGTIYGQGASYGFEPGSSVNCVDRGGKDALRSDFCASDQPFCFSVAVPEGNYRVTVTLGDARANTVTTIKAELRRLMIERVETKAGQYAVRTFTVNVRTPKIAADGEVKLKEREKTSEWRAWDEKLTLEFNNSHPTVNAIEITKVDELPTLYLLGDSTVCDQPLEPYNSWGQMLTRFFRPEITIANNAESGESLRSSLGAHRLDKVLSTMRPGDYLLIQYGHNDEKEKGEGIGPFTSYKADLKKFVTEARKRGGIPVLITPVQRRTFDSEGKITNSHGDYPEAVRQVSREENVPLIDLNAQSKLLYEAWGPEESKKAFAPNDNTHHDNYGSYELAKCVMMGIKSVDRRLASFLVTNVATFDPRHPDAIDNFSIPPSPTVSGAKPLGN